MLKVERYNEDFDDEIENIYINGKALITVDCEHWHLPRKLRKGLKTSELPLNVIFQPCECSVEEAMQLSSIPIEITRIDNNKLRVHFEEGLNLEDEDDKDKFQTWMKTKKEITTKRKKLIGDIESIEFEVDDTFVCLEYTKIIEADYVEEAIQEAEDLNAELDGETELQLGWSLFDLEEDNLVINDESDFTLRKVIPVLSALGFENVKYNHGKREYGKDITFSRLTEFGDREYYAAQIKYGDISGGVNSDVDTLIKQADDAFRMPFSDLYTKQKQRISKLVFVVSGKFTENAIEKICEKIESHAIKNNLLFIDGVKLESLAQQTRSKRK